MEGVSAWWGDWMMDTMDTCPADVGRQRKSNARPIPCRSPNRTETKHVLILYGSHYKRNKAKTNRIEQRTTYRNRVSLLRVLLVSSLISYVAPFGIFFFPCRIRVFPTMTDIRSQILASLSFFSPSSLENFIATLSRHFLVDLLLFSCFQANSFFSNQPQPQTQSTAACRSHFSRRQPRNEKNTTHGQKSSRISLPSSGMPAQAAKP